MQTQTAADNDHYFDVIAGISVETLDAVINGSVIIFSTNRAFQLFLTSLKGQSTPINIHRFTNFLQRNFDELQPELTQLKAMDFIQI